MRVGYVKTIPTNHGMARATGRMPATAAAPECRARCAIDNGQEPPEMPPGYRTMIDTDGAKH